MANRIHQFRYYADGHAKNQPKLCDKTIFYNETAFAPYYPITQLGIQSLPGTKFYLNNSTDPIIIGTTGIYELELNNQTQITKIAFDPTSLQAIENNPTAFLIIDILYDKEDVL